MRALVEQYCAECLLSIIEMQQFKDRLFKEALKHDERLAIARSMDRQLTKYFLVIPRDCARSVQYTFLVIVNVIGIIIIHSLRALYGGKARTTS